MGFNFNLTRNVGERFTQGRAVPSECIHAPDCGADHFICMCEFGFDTSTHVGDRDLYVFIVANSTQSYDDTGEEIYRPRDFQAVREAARTMTSPQRALQLIDLLERDSNLWIMGGQA